MGRQDQRTGRLTQSIYMPGHGVYAIGIQDDGAAGLIH